MVKIPLLVMGRDPVELAKRAKYQPPAMRVRGVMAGSGVAVTYERPGIGDRALSDQALSDRALSDRALSERKGNEEERPASLCWSWQVSKKNKGNGE